MKHSPVDSAEGYHDRSEAKYGGENIGKLTTSLLHEQGKRRMCRQEKMKSISKTREVSR